MPKYKVFVKWEVEEEANSEEEAVTMALDSLAESNDSLENQVQVEEVK